MSEPIKVENKNQNLKKPPLNPVKIVCEILAGSATGLVVALPVLYVILYIIFGVMTGWDQKNLGGLGGSVVTMAIMLWGFPPVYGLASTLGVYLVGSRSNQTGLFLATLGGGLLGGCFLLPVSPFTYPDWYFLLSAEGIVLRALVLLIPPVLATVGFNLTRRYKEEPPSP